MKRLIVLLAIIASVWACKQRGTEPVSMSVSEEGNVTEQPIFQDSLANDPSKGAEQFEGLRFSDGAETLSIVGEDGKTYLVFADGSRVELVKKSYSPAYPAFSPFHFDTDAGEGSAVFVTNGMLTIGTNHGDGPVYRLIK